MKRNRAGRSAIGTSLRVAVLVVVALGVARLVSRAIEESNAGDVAGLRQTLTFGAATAGAIVLVVAAVALALVPSARRMSVLAARYPDANVANGRWNPDLVAILSRHLQPGARESELKGSAFTLVAGLTGLSFWAGVRKPKEVAAIGWAEIASIATGTIALSPTRNASTVQLVLDAASGTTEFALSSNALLGAYPQDTDSVKAMVGELQVMRRRATSN